MKNSLLNSSPMRCLNGIRSRWKVSKGKKNSCCYLYAKHVPRASVEQISTVCLNDLLMAEASLCLESLPDELLYEIFDYIDILQLYQTFFDLNQRLNSILDTISCPHFQTESLEEASHPLVDRFASRITHLTAGQPNNVDLTRYPNGRSLEFFDFLPGPQLEQVQFEHFPHLVFLRTSYSEDCSIAAMFFRMVFSNHFPSLRGCVFDEIFQPDAVHRWSHSPSIRMLEAGGFSVAVYSMILASCPNLTLIYIGPPYVMRDTDIPPMPVQHTSLKRLHIRTINTQTIETILTDVPDLKRLHIVSDWSRGNNCSPLNFVRLACVLSRRVPRLCRFGCDTKERDPLSIDTIRGFHRCFDRIQCALVPDGRTHFFLMRWYGWTCASWGQHRTQASSSEGDQCWTSFSRSTTSLFGQWQKSEVRVNLHIYWAQMIIE